MTLSTLLGNLFGAQKKTRKTVAQYQHDMLTKNAREQFQYLLKKNLRIPVVFL